MFEIERYVEKLIDSLRGRFGQRLLYVGLQGSYLRGEATEASDIDIMAVLDELSLEDLDAYREILVESGEKERSCGFISGAKELGAWNSMEICQLIHTTKDCFGCLNDLLPGYTRQDEINYVKMSLNNLYHALCHRYIHAGREKSLQKLSGDYKSAFFILQNLHYLESGVFALTRAGLTARLTGEDRAVMETEAILRDGRACDREAALSALFGWTQQAMLRADKL